MIILDTNVISELMRPAPDANVVGWLSAQPGASLFTTAIAVAEIHYGVRLLPGGKRRVALEQLAAEIFTIDLGGRILAFGSDAAELYGSLAADRRRLGQPISTQDAQIAAIARSFSATLATRNEADFEHCGLVVVNPWEPQP